MPNRDGFGPYSLYTNGGRGFRSYGQGNGLGLAVLLGGVVGYGYHMYKRRHRPVLDHLGIDEGFTLQQEKTILENRLNQIEELMDH